MSHGIVVTHQRIRGIFRGDFFSVEIDGEAIGTLDGTTPTDHDKHANVAFLEKLAVKLGATIEWKDGETAYPNPI